MPDFGVRKLITCKLCGQQVMGTRTQEYCDHHREQMRIARNEWKLEQDRKRKR